MSEITTTPARPAELAEADIADAVGPVYAARLAAEGVHTLADWRRLGRRRHRLFGIVPRVVRELDRAAERGP